ncbi:peptidoglycan-binding domain-containing protein [Microbacterium lacticum]
MIAGTSLGILAVAAVVLAAQGTIAFQQREDRPDRPNAITTTVRNEQLVDSVRADARAVPEHTWTVEAEGTVTRPGARAGQLVESGSVLAVVDERPLFLLDGSVPMYRSLAPGAVGSDVEQLQIALAALGYYNYWVDGEYEEETASAVYWFYVESGFVPIDAAGSSVSRDERATASIPRTELTFAPGGNVVTASDCGDLAQRIAGDLCTLQSGAQTVVIEPSEADAPRIMVGQEVSVQIGAEALEGVVGGVYAAQAPSEEPGADEDSSATQGREQNDVVAKFTVTVSDSSSVASGATGSATVTIETTSPDGLVVESVAIREDRDGSTWLLTAGADRVEATVGLCLRGVCVVEGDGILDGLDVVIPVPGQPVAEDDDD